MTFTQIVWVRRVLGLALVGFGALVATQLTRSKTGLPRGGDPVTLPESTHRTHQVQHRTLDEEGRTVFELIAAERIGASGSTQEFRDVTLRFEAGVEKLPLQVTGDRCRLDTVTQIAHLDGNVVVTGPQDLRIEVDRLDYRSQPAAVETDQPLRFRRRGMEGRAGGLQYAVLEAEINLVGDVEVNFIPAEGPPVRIVSRTAVIRRRQSLVQFVDDVVVQGQDRTLRCNDLQLYLTEDERGLTVAQAYENVEVAWTRSPTPDPEEASKHVFGEPGEKRLRTENLEIVFEADGSTIDRVRALEGAELVIDPPPPGATAEPPLRRSVSANMLVFEMRPDGRLEDFRGRGGATLVLEPVGGPPSEVRRIEARQFESVLDPATGELVEARCHQSVQFSKGDIRATADEGVYRAKHNRLNLTGSPRLWDLSTTLEAERVDIDVTTGDLEAEGGVRTRQEKGGSSQAALDFLPGGEDAASVHFVSERFEYARARNVALYSGAVRGIRGESLLEGDQVALDQGAGRVEASGSARTSFLQRGKGGKVERIKVSAGLFTYASEEEILRYREGAEVSTPDLSLKAQRVYLIPGEDGLREISASGRVEVVIEGTRARGDRMTYDAKEDRMVVGGEPASIQDGDKLTEGKELTLLLSNDTILVDGQQESRTKTVYTSKPRPF